MKLVAISGGFDPIQPGHVVYIEEAKKLGDKLIVILSRDDQLVAKKGYCFMPYLDRMTILRWGLRYNDMIFENIDKDITCRESLKYYKPDIFAKGGDTWNAENLPEWDVCKELGIDVVFGVGGFDKRGSSSDYVKRVKFGYVDK